MKSARRNPSLHGSARPAASRPRASPTRGVQGPGEQAGKPALESQADRVAVRLAGSDLSARLASGAALREAAGVNDATAAGPASAPLPGSVREPAEQVLGHDLSAVRVHADAHAAHRTGGADAHATTERDDIYFNRGRYRPDHPLGRALIWHELTHVAQQRDPDDALDPATLGAMADAHAEYEAPLFGRGPLHMSCDGCGCTGDSSKGGGEQSTSSGGGGQARDAGTAVQAGKDAGAGVAAKPDPDVPPAGLDAKYTDYYKDINSAVAALNKRLGPKTPLDPDWIRAMMATESVSGTDARKYDPLQAANRGDQGLGIFKGGKDHSELIDPTLKGKLKDKITTPHKGGKWDYSALNDKERMDAANGILLGVAFLYLKAATFTFVTDETGELLTTKVLSSDKSGFTSVAARVGTTTGVLQKYNPSVDSSKLRAGVELSYKKATQSWKITGWSSWEDAIEAYNGGGDPDYLKKVKAHYDAIKKGSKPKEE